MRKPSVSDLLNLLDKPALLGWANRIGLEGESLIDARRKSMSKGTSLHREIEHWLTRETPIKDDDFFINVKSFFSDKEILAVEKPIVHDRFTGRLDVKYKDKDGFVFVCDFKSNQSRLYRENLLQLTAYRMAENCDRVAIISIPSMKILDPWINNFKPYEKTVLILADLYQALSEIS
jgi:hypothetical protein